VLQAALFDVLTMQCNRHAGNVHVTEQGGILLLGTEVCLKAVQSMCSYNSVLLPGSQLQEVARFGQDYVWKRYGAAQPDLAAVKPELLLDYRCHVDGWQAAAEAAQGRRATAGAGDPSQGDKGGGRRRQQASRRARALRKAEAGGAAANSTANATVGARWPPYTTWPLLRHNLPEGFKKCLKFLAGHTHQHLTTHYQLPDYANGPGVQLRNRAVDLKEVRLPPLPPLPPLLALLALLACWPAGLLPLGAWGLL
jgi:hypothetical protein